MFGYVRLGYVRLGYVWICEVRLGYVRLGYVLLYKAYTLCMHDPPGVLLIFFVSSPHPGTV